MLAEARMTCKHFISIRAGGSSLYTSVALSCGDERESYPAVRTLYHSARIM